MEEIKKIAVQPKECAESVICFDWNNQYLFLKELADMASSHPAEFNNGLHWLYDEIEKHPEDKDNIKYLIDTIQEYLC